MLGNELCKIELMPLLCDIRLQMFGHAGLPCMSCWLGHTLSRIQMSQETFGKQYKYIIGSCYFISLIFSRNKCVG